jgi:hypothetical protein
MAKGKNTSPKLLITHYMKLDIYDNGCKNIPNNIMGNHAFPVVGTPQKVYRHPIYTLAAYALGQAMSY